LGIHSVFSESMICKNISSIQTYNKSVSQTFHSEFGNFLSVLVKNINYLNYIHNPDFIMIKNRLQRKDIAMTCTCRNINPLFELKDLSPRVQCILIIFPWPRSYIYGIVHFFFPMTQFIVFPPFKITL